MGNDNGGDHGNNNNLIRWASIILGIVVPFTIAMITLSNSVARISERQLAVIEHGNQQDRELEGLRNRLGSFYDRLDDRIRTLELEVKALEKIGRSPP